MSKSSKSKSNGKSHANGTHVGPVAEAAPGPLALSAEEKAKLKGLSDTLAARQAALGEAVYKLMAAGAFPLVQQTHEAQEAVAKFAADALRARGYDPNDNTKKFHLDTQALTLTRTV